MRRSISLSRTRPNTIRIGAGGTRFKTAGELVNTSGAPYQECKMQAAQGDKVVYSAAIQGIFEETVVFRPVSGKPLDIQLSCSGASEIYNYRLERIPRPFGKVVDFGRVALD